LLHFSSKVTESFERYLLFVSFKKPILIPTIQVHNVFNGITVATRPKLLFTIVRFKARNFATWSSAVGHQLPVATGGFVAINMRNEGGQCAINLDGVIVLSTILAF
jgi:hypothetical protein